MSNRNGNRRKTPLICIELEKTQNAKEIFNLTHLMYLRVTVESLRRKSGPGQCYRCQRFGHAANCCRLEPRCVSCGKKHFSYKCDSDKSTTPPKCANCDKQHPANYRGCEKYPTQTNRRRRELPTRINRSQHFEKTRQGVSYAAATKNNENTVDNKEEQTNGGVPQMPAILNLIQLLMNASPDKLKTISKLLESPK